MTHPHMTSQCKVKLLKELVTFEQVIDSLENIDMNEDAASDIFAMTNILRHEIELISVEER